MVAINLRTAYGKTQIALVSLGDKGKTCISLVKCYNKKGNKPTPQVLAPKHFVKLGRFSFRGHFKTEIFEQELD